MKLENMSYQKRLEIFFILTLVLLIVTFISFQKFSGEQIISYEIQVPEIMVIDIPRTIQKNAQRPPRPLQPAIPVPVDEIEILNDIPIELDIVSDLPVTDRILSSEEIEGLPYLPRQILEVVPEQTGETYNGEIILTLHIAKDGKVKNHKILSNTTNSENCLQSVLRAAYKSRWQPVIIDNRIYEYWIEKSYQFN